MSFSDIIDSVYKFVFAVQEVRIKTEYKGIIRVAAGDPTIGLRSILEDEKLIGSKTELIRILNSDNLPEDEKQWVEQAVFFEVIGSSMVPRGIDNGDILVCEKFDLDPGQDFSEKPMYPVIKVDKVYYEMNNKEIRFDYKLRKAVMLVDNGKSEEELVKEVERISPEIILRRNRKSFSEKLKVAKEFYGDKLLMLSITFRNGSLRYSFHPVDLIEYSVKYVLKHTDKGWRCHDIMEIGKI